MFLNCTYKYRGINASQFAILITWMWNLVLYVNLQLMDNWIFKAVVIIMTYEITLNNAFTDHIFVIHILLGLWIIWIYFDERSTKE